MSEEILEQQSEEELEEAKLAAVKSSGRKIKEQEIQKIKNNIEKSSRKARDQALVKAFEDFIIKL